MALSDDLARLSVRAKQAEERAAAAKAKARDQLEHMVEEARDSTQETADKLRRDSSAAAGRADAWADNMQQSWNEHLSEMRDRHEARKARHAADRAEADAEDAENYAAYSINSAYSAFDEAEFAVLDAILAREDAEGAAHMVSG